MQEGGEINTDTKKECVNNVKKTVITEIRSQKKDLKTCNKAAFAGF